MENVDILLENTNQGLKSQQVKIFTPVGRSTWEPEQSQQQKSFGGTSLRIKVLKDKVEGLYQKLSERLGATPEAFHFDYFELER